MYIYIYACIHITVLYKCTIIILRACIYEQRKKLGIQKPCRIKLKIPSSDHKNDHTNLKQPCRITQQRIKT